MALTLRPTILPVTAATWRRPGMLEASLVLLIMAGKISFWLPVPLVGVNLSPFAFALLLLLFFARSFRPEDLAVTVQHTQLLFWGCILVFLSLSTALVVKHTPMYAGMRYIYAVESMAAIYVFAMLFRRDDSIGFRCILAWSGPIISFYFLFIFALAHNFSFGQMTHTLIDALRLGNPNQFAFAITHTIITGTDDQINFREFGINTRHGWSSALLVALLLSLVYAPARGRAKVLQPIWYGLLGLNVLLLVMLMSRAVVLGAVLGFALSLMTRGGGKIWQIVGLAGGAAITVGMLAVTGLGQVFIDHFVSNTGSYTGRLRGFDAALQRIDGNVLFGFDRDTVTVSAHNWPLDLWQAAGLVALVGALAMVTYFLIEIARTIVVAPNARKLPHPLGTFGAVAFVVLGIFVVIRFLTAGYGIIDRHEALAAGVFVAWACRFRAAAIDAGGSAPIEGGDSAKAPPSLAARARTIRADAAVARSG